MKVQQNYYAASGTKPTGISGPNNNDFGVVGQTALKNLGRKEGPIPPQSLKPEK